MPSVRSIYGGWKIDEEFEGVGKRSEAEELRRSVSISRVGQLRGMYLT